MTSSGDDELAVRFEKSLECKHSFITELVGTHCRYCGRTAFSVLAEYATAVSDEAGERPTFQLAPEDDATNQP